MTGFERPSPETLLKKEAWPAVLGGENSENALELSNALNYRAWGIPAVLSKGTPGKALRASPGSFRIFLAFPPPPNKSTISSFFCRMHRKRVQKSAQGRKKSASAQKLQTTRLKQPGLGTPKRGVGHQVALAS